MNWVYDLDTQQCRTGWLGLLFLLLAMGELQAQTPHFDRLQERIASGELIHARFVHTYQDSYTGEQNRSEGEIWIAGDAYRVEDERQTMIVDGEVSRIYDADRNRLLINTYIEEEDDFAPSRMLQGVQDSYSVTELERRTTVSIQLTTDDPFELFREVEIIVDSDGVPLEIRALDQADNLLTTRFENGVFEPMHPDVFSLSIPEGAERIDLRE